MWNNDEGASKGVARCQLSNLLSYFRSSLCSKHQFLQTESNAMTRSNRSILMTQRPAAALVLLCMICSRTSESFTPTVPLFSSLPGHEASSSSISVATSTPSVEKMLQATSKRSNPVVVSEEAEALSHSDTTMKLTPSYELFQMLAEEEGGVEPPVAKGNALRDGSHLSHSSPLLVLKVSNHASRSFGSIELIGS